MTSPPWSYTVTGLDPTVAYYVRVAAENDVPPQQVSHTGVPPTNQRWEVSTPSAVRPENQLPGPPATVEVERIGATALRVYIFPPALPLGDGGQAITKYLIEWDPLSSFDSTPRSQYSIEIDVDSMSALYEGGALMYDITNLEAGTPYYVLSLIHI